MTSADGYDIDETLLLVLSTTSSGNAKTVSAEITNTETTSFETINAETTNSETTNAENETTNAETINAEMTNDERTSAETIHKGNVEYAFQISYGYNEETSNRQKDDEVIPFVIHEKIQ